MAVVSEWVGHRGVGWGERGVELWGRWGGEGLGGRGGRGRLYSPLMLVDHIQAQSPRPIVGGLLSQWNQGPHVPVWGALCLWNGVPLLM